MEPFEIIIDGTTLNVQPLANESFSIYDGVKLIGVITPILRNDLQIEWVTADLLAKNYAQAIGKAIEARER